MAEVLIVALWIIDKVIMYLLFRYELRRQRKEAKKK